MLIQTSIQHLLGFRCVQNVKLVPRFSPVWLLSTQLVNRHFCSAPRQMISNSPSTSCSVCPVLAHEKRKHLFNFFMPSRMQIQSNFLVRCFASYRNHENFVTIVVWLVWMMMLPASCIQERENLLTYNEMQWNLLPIETKPVVFVQWFFVLIYILLLHQLQDAGTVRLKLLQQSSYPRVEESWGIPVCSFWFILPINF